MIQSVPFFSMIRRCACLNRARGRRGRSISNFLGKYKILNYANNQENEENYYIFQIYNGKEEVKGKERLNQTSNASTTVRSPLLGRDKEEMPRDPVLFMIPIDTLGTEQNQSLSHQFKDLTLTLPLKYQQSIMAHDVTTAGGVAEVAPNILMGMPRRAKPRKGEQKFQPQQPSVVVVRFTLPSMILMLIWSVVLGYGCLYLILYVERDTSCYASHDSDYPSATKYAGADYISFRFTSLLMLWFLEHCFLVIRAFFGLCKGFSGLKKAYYVKQTYFLQNHLLYGKLLRYQCIPYKICVFVNYIFLMILIGLTGWWTQDKVGRVCIGWNIEGYDEVLLRIRGIALVGLFYGYSVAMMCVGCWVCSRKCKEQKNRHMVYELEEEPLISPRETQTAPYILSEAKSSIIKK